MSTNPGNENFDEQGNPPLAGEDQRYHIDTNEQPESGSHENTEPRGNTAPLDAPYEYPAYPPPYVQPGVYQEPREPERRRGRPWFVNCLFVVLILLVVLVVAVGIFLFAVHSSPSTTTTHSYIVGSHPTIIVSNDTGNIVVHTGGTSNGVTIAETRSSTPFGGSTNNVQVIYARSTADNTITVHVSRNSGTSFFNTPSVAFDISVPSVANVELSTSTGSISVNGVSGKLSLQSNTGSVSASNVGLTGTSLLKTNTGSINYNGTIGTSGTYQFQSNTGSVNITLPRSTSFRLNATTDTGSLNTSFPGIKIQHNTVGNQASGNVGSSPAATVTLTTNTGSITLNAAP